VAQLPADHGSGRAGYFTFANRNADLNGEKV
jgi:hypothetical protein